MAHPENSLTLAEFADRFESGLNNILAQTHAVSLMADGLFQRDEEGGLAVGAMAEAIEANVTGLLAELEGCRALQDCGETEGARPAPYREVLNGGTRSRERPRLAG
ncbi:MAG: hypothetical protein WEB63_10180 [Cucumibacter sp.]